MRDDRSGTTEPDQEGFLSRVQTCLTNLCGDSGEDQASKGGGAVVQSWAGTNYSGQELKQWVFSGKGDEDFMNLSILGIRTKFYDSREIAAKRHYGHINATNPDSVYIFEFGYSENDVKELAKQGKFSQTIKRAFRCCEQWAADNRFIKQEEVPTLINPNFDSNLLDLAKNTGPQASQPDTFELDSARP